MSYASRFGSLIVLLAVCFGFVPVASPRAQAAVRAVAPAAAASAQPAQFPVLATAAPAPLQAPPAPVPGLTLTLVAVPNPVAVGATVTVSITVQNQGTAAADQLQVRMSLPGETTALPGGTATTPGQRLQWDVARLDTQQTATLTATLRVDRMPLVGALVFRGVATARNVRGPTRSTGGVVVFDPAQGPATTIFTPGAPTQLHSSDGLVTVVVPARAATRLLTLRHARTPVPGTRPPTTTPLGRRSFGVLPLFW